MSITPLLTGPMEEPQSHVKPVAKRVRTQHESHEAGRQFDQEPAAISLQVVLHAGGILQEAENLANPRRGLEVFGVCDEIGDVDEGLNPLWRWDRIGENPSGI